MNRRACVFALAVVASARAAFPQLESAPSADDAFTSVDARIEAIQSTQGDNSPDLIDPVTRLGLILRERGELNLAAAAFEHARHLVRVNYGLSSFKEAPLLRQLVQIEEARGNAAGAWSVEQELITLIRRNPGPAAAPMLREIADKRVDVLERYVAGELPPQIRLGCYYAEPDNPTSGRRGNKSCGSGNGYRAKLNLLDEARFHYYDVMDMIRYSEGASSAQLPELDMALARAEYAARNDYSTEGQGRGLLRRAHERYVKYSAPLPVQMSALVQVTDWDLLFAGGRKKNDAAFQAYVALYDQLKQNGLDQQFIDSIFSPSVPVVLPSFSRNPFVSTETWGPAEYIDVAFDITKYGESEAIEILDTSTNTAAEAGIHLKDLIRRTRFRPRMADGAFEDPARVEVRYYVND